MYYISVIPDQVSSKQDYPVLPPDKTKKKGSKD